MGSQPITPPFTLDQMNQLLAKAVAHVGENGTMQPFSRMHRTKPSGDWNKLRGPLLPVQPKDGGGHQQAPINHSNQQNQRIKGVHFSAKTCASGAMPIKSPYGDERFAIDASLLLNPDLFNVYFADFYCSGGEHQKHRISLLVVRKDRSVEIDYCQGKMPQLDLSNNPFVRVKKLLVNSAEELHFQLCAWDEIWVEFFITEDVSFFVQQKKITRTAWAIIIIFTVKVFNVQNDNNNNFDQHSQQQMAHSKWPNKLLPTEFLTVK